MSHTQKLSLQSDEFELRYELDGKFILKELAKNGDESWHYDFNVTRAGGYDWTFQIKRYKKRKDWISVYLCCSKDDVFCSYDLTIQSYIKDKADEFYCRYSLPLTCKRWATGWGWGESVRLKEFTAPEKDLKNRVIYFTFNITVFGEEKMEEIGSPESYMMLGQSIRENIDSDFTIVLKDESVLHTHQVVLKASSPVLKAMLSHNVRESLDSRITIDDFDPAIVRALVNSFYTGQIPADCDLKTMFAIADKYKVNSLAKKCLSKLASNVTVDTACFVLGSMNRCNYFKGMPQETKVSQFIHDHYGDIEATEDFQAFSKDPAFLLCILQHRGKKRKRDEDS